MELFVTPPDLPFLAVVIDRDFVLSEFPPVFRTGLSIDNAKDQWASDTCR